MGLIVLLTAAVVAIVGVLSNAGATHPLTDFSVFGYHLTGGTGTLFLFGIAVGAVASLGLFLLLTGAQRSASRAADAQRAAARLRREMAFINRDHETRSEHQERADRAVGHPRSRATAHHAAREGRYSI
ncbi:hypothetical protein [Mycobacterium sp. MMS18-G62]